MKYYRLMTMLPALPLEPQPPPWPLQQVILALDEELDATDRALAEAMLGMLDCRNVEATLRGIEVFDERAPLTAETIAAGGNLPEYLQRFLRGDDQGTLPDAERYDLLWQAYFSQLLETAHRSKSGFLRAWAESELDLRTRLAGWRAAALGLSRPTRPAGNGGSGDPAAVVAALPDASDPLTRERQLDSWRLHQLERLQGIDGFSADAALAYLAAALVLDGWDAPATADVAGMLEVML